MDAYDRESKAYNDYYTGLMKLGPNVTEEQRRTLRERTVLPARVSTANEFGKIFNEQKQSVFRLVFESLKRRLGEAMIPKWIVSIMKQDSLAASGPPLDPGPATIHSSPPAPAMTSSQPEQALDGSNIPREIEFTPRPR